jgi:hypothetical protein
MDIYKWCQSKSSPSKSFRNFWSKAKVKTQPLLEKYFRENEYYDVTDVKVTNTQTRIFFYLYRSKKRVMYSINQLQYLRVHMVHANAAKMSATTSICCISPSRTAMCCFV